MLKARAPFALELPDDAWFDVRLMRKDVRLALEAADRLHVSAPSGRAALRALTSAGELGYDHRDIAALFEALDKTS